MDKMLAQVIERMKKINDQQAELERAAHLENDGEFTDEQRDQYKALDSLFKELEAQKKQIEEDIDLLNARQNREDAMKIRVQPRKAPANSGAPSRPRSGMPVETENSETGERHIRFSIPKSVRRLGNLKSFHGVKDKLNAEERAYRFGQWVLAQVSRDLPGRYSFPMATEFVKNYLDPTNTAHGESDAVTGGHVLVPEEFSRDIIDLRERYGVVRRLFGRAPMMSDTLSFPRRASGLTASFTAENAAASESNTTWSNVQLVAKKLTALSRMSNELSQDAVIAIGDMLAGEMAYAFANKEDECGFNGNGASTYGGIEGARTLITSIDGAGTNSAGLQAATGNSWSAIVLADFNNTVGKLPQFADTENTVWVCHKTFYHAVMQKLEMAAGGVQAREIAEGDRRPRPMFMGYPVEFSQVFPATSASASVVCLLGDFQLAALFGDRQQSSIAFSEHASVGGENVFERDQIAVRGTERFDIVVHSYGDASNVGAYVGLETT